MDTALAVMSTWLIGPMVSVAVKFWVNFVVEVSGELSTAFGRLIFRSDELSFVASGYLSMFRRYCSSLVIGTEHHQRSKLGPGCAAFITTGNRPHADEPTATSPGALLKVALVHNPKMYSSKEIHKACRWPKCFAFSMPSLRRIVGSGWKAVGVSMR
jgi:hypothetical protein